MKSFQNHHSCSEHTIETTVAAVEITHATAHVHKKTQSFRVFLELAWKDNAIKDDYTAVQVLSAYQTKDRSCHAS